MTSRLVQMQARFQQKQIQEKEEKLLRLYENQQQRAFEKVSRGSAGSNTSLGSTGGGKVRQMFDERRQKAGIDRSYPLEPLKTTRSNGQARGGSVERVKGYTNRTVVKSTVQKNVSQIRNGKPLVNKQEVVHSIYNNNDGDESYEEVKYETDLNQTFNKSHPDLIDMMNNHNLNDTLDNEELPQLGFDEPDEIFFSGKLANLGGKLPSEAVAGNVTDKKLSKGVNSTLGKTFRKETKPVVKRTAKPSVPHRTSTSSPTAHPQSTKATSSSLASPVRSASQTMQPSAKSPPTKKGTPQTPQSAKASCNTRSSAKQSAKTPVARDDLNECRYCNRRFAADRLELHESICGKTLKKKRKVYDATKHRVEGTELEQYVRRGKTTSSKPTNKAGGPKKDWRRTHEEFINAIRSAKMAQAHVAKGGRLSDLPPPPPSSNPDYVQCPHCGRKFNEAAAERHIPKCANYQFNKPKPGAPPKGKNGGKR